VGGTRLQDVVLVLAVATAVAAAAGALLLWRRLREHRAAVRRLTGDVRVLLDAHPGHRPALTGPSETAELAAAVTDLAERRAAAEQDVAREVKAARADVEQERNRLAALMSDLTVAVLVCSPGGRIVLYNSAARALLGDDPALGLGRSVFGVVDRDLVTHALDRTGDGQVATHVSTVLRGGALLQVRLAPVRGDDGAVTGFVLLLEDTSHLQASRRRDALLRGSTERTRAAAASIRAAVETVLDYPDMAAEEREQFLRIVAEESARLGDEVEGWVAGAAQDAPDEVRPDMRVDDLLTVVGRDLERRTGVATSVEASSGEPWVRADSHALARALEPLVVRLRDAHAVRAVQLRPAPVGDRHVRLDLVWSGEPLASEALRWWLDEPAAGSAAGRVREVVERHGGEVWTGSGAADGRQDCAVCLLLPVAEQAPRPQLTVAAAESRPEFYDFDLFDLPQQALALQDRRLADLSYVVFDTETTGFSPTEGDEVVAVGAVRVGGGRVRRSEVFERLGGSGPERARRFHPGARDHHRHGEGSASARAGAAAVRALLRGRSAGGPQRRLRPELPARCRAAHRGALHPAGPGHAAARRGVAPRPRGPLAGVRRRAARRRRDRAAHGPR
jgi:DNA polymerase-3 subunit epsilon